MNVKVFGALEAADGTMVRGSASGQEIFLALGEALSRWEAAEDQLMSLFKIFVSEREHVAFAAYVKSPRSGRNQMLKLAFKIYSRRAKSFDVAAVLKSMKKFDKLAAIRNELAHGTCVNHQHHNDGKVVAGGVFLMSSFSETGWHQRSRRFIHSAETIRAFIAAVKVESTVIADAAFALSQFDQYEWQSRSGAAKAVATLASGMDQGVYLDISSEYAGNYIASYIP